MSADVRFRVVYVGLIALFFNLSTVSALAAAPTACPNSPNWITGADGRCYGVFVQPNPFVDGAVGAEDFCQTTMNATGLASITDATVNRQIINLLSNVTATTPVSSVRYAFIGLSDVGLPGMFNWTDNTTVTYSNLSASEANRHFVTGDSRCVALNSPDGKWQSNVAWTVVPCCFQPSKINAVVCNIIVNKTVGPPANSAQTQLRKYCYGGCPTGWMAWQTKCYSVSAQQYVYQNIFMARQSCLRVGADIPYFAGASEEEFLRYVIAKEANSANATSTRSYIGINNITSGVWVDQSGSSPTYLNWKNGVAISSSTPDNKTTDCAQIVWDGTTSSWTAVSCCTPANVTFLACQKPQNGSVLVPVASNVFASHCYASYNACLSNPCYGNATCQNNVVGFECKCPAGYSGDNCNITACANNPCLNGGTCTMNYMASNGYVCTCPSAYSGTKCETVIDQCVLAPCQNGGTCKTLGTTNYTCTCPYGTNGYECQNVIDMCGNYTCQNGGTCVGYIGFANCSCVPSKGGAHCEEEIKCTTPLTATTIVNATLNTTSGTTGTYGSTVTYICLPGTKFPDESIVKTYGCYKSPVTYLGDWNDTIAPCSPHCAILPSVGNAVIGNPYSSVGNTVNFTCQTGFILPNNETTINTTCLANLKWSNDLSNTTCNIRRCPALPKWPYQSVDTFNNTYNTTVTFWCDVGYVLFDNTTARTIKCLADGNWTADLPPCNPVKCPQLDVPPGSSRNTSNNTYMTYAQYSCDGNKRMLDGSTYRIILCDATGDWSDNVTDCTDTRCFPLPYVANATPSTTDADYWVTSTLSCIPGHRFFINNIKYNEQAMTCQSNGWWNPILPSCQPILCPPVPTAVNIIPSTLNHLYGTVVNFLCLLGYYVNPNTPYQYNSLSIECQDSEQWNSTDIPDCWPIQCSSPPNITNGTRVLPANYNYSSQVYYQCQNGTKFIDGRTEKYIVCKETGLWDDNDVSCRSDRCDPVSIQPNSVVDTRSTAWYTNVTYTCKTGYEWKANTTKRAVMCKAGGVWNDTFTANDDCTIKHCSPITKMGNATSNTTNQNWYNSYVQYTCNTGYLFPDNTTTKVQWCSDKPQWVWVPTPKQTPVCNIIHCPALPDVENATRDTNDTYYDITVTYSCQPGYQYPDKTKQKQVSCDSNGTWSEFPPACEVIYCQPLPTWSEAIFNSTDNNFLSTVSYWCSDGYAFKGHDKQPGNGTVLTTTCLANKVWYPAVASCLSLQAINAAIAGKTYNSPQAVPIGTVACAVMCIVMASVVLLDASKIFSDLKMMKANIGKLVRGGKSNKVVPKRSK